MQPGDSPLNHPTDFPQSTSMGSPSLGDLRCDLPSGQEVAHQLGVISPVALNTLGLPACTSLLSADSVDCIYQGDGLGDIGDVGACQPCRQGDTLGVGDQVLLTAVTGPVCRIRPDLFPPFKARTELLSMIALDQSSWSACWSCASRSSWTFCQTPALFQSRKRRQQLMPQPHSSSCGIYPQGIPVFKTNRMPVNARRLSMGFRPGNRKRHNFGAGSKGSISAQSSSEGIGPLSTNSSLFDRCS